MILFITSVSKHLPVHNNHKHKHKRKDKSTTIIYDYYYDADLSEQQEYYLWSWDNIEFSRCVSLESCHYTIHGCMILNYRYENQPFYA